MLAWRGLDEKTFDQLISTGASHDELCKNLWVQLPCCYVVSSMPIEGAFVFTYEQFMINKPNVEVLTRQVESYMERANVYSVSIDLTRE